MLMLGCIVLTIRSKTFHKYETAKISRRSLKSIKVFKIALKGNREYGARPKNTGVKLNDKHS